MNYLCLQSLLKSNWEEPLKMPLTLDMSQMFTKTLIEWLLSVPIIKRRFQLMKRFLIIFKLLILLDKKIKLCF